MSPDEVKQKYYRKKREMDEARKSAEEMEKRSEERMREIRPKKLPKGQLIWKGDDLEQMSELDRELEEDRMRRKQDSSIFDYLDPFGILHLKEHAGNLQTQIQSSLDQAINDLIMDPAKRQWQSMMQERAGERHEEGEAHGHEEKQFEDRDERGEKMEARGRRKDREEIEKSGHQHDHEHDHDHGLGKVIEFKGK